MRKLFKDLNRFKNMCPAHMANVKKTLYLFIIHVTYLAHLTTEKRRLKKICFYMIIDRLRQTRNLLRTTN